MKKVRSSVFLLVAAVLLQTARFSHAQDPFIRLAIEPSSPYAGQPFSIRLSVYTAGQDLDTMAIAGIPPALRLQPFEHAPPVTERIGDRDWQVFHSRCEAIAPEAGRLRFEPVLHAMLVRTIQSRIWAQTVRTPVRLGTAPIDLDIRPIPTDSAPPGYGGLIGAFTLDGSASTNRLLPGDLVTLTFTLAGEGRFDLAPPLGYRDAEGFKVYPPRDVKGRDGARARTFTQVVVPQSPDSLSLPPFSLTVFNPNREGFDVLTAGPFVFEPDTERPVHAPPPPPPIDDEGRDPLFHARPIHAAPARWPGDPAIRGEAEDLFLAGVRAHAENRFTDAIDAYSKLMALGVRPPEADVNLGVAFLRLDRRGKAVLFLLRAVRASPRDDLARGHLADAAAPGSPPRLPFWSRFSPREWRAGIWLGGLFAFLFLALSFRRRTFVTAALVAFALALTAASGASWWRRGPPQTERVVMECAQGRLAPLESASPTLTLPEGAAVRLLESANGWARVESAGGTAWIPIRLLEKP